MVMGWYLCALVMCVLPAVCMHMGNLYTHSCALYVCGTGMAQLCESLKIFELILVCFWVSLVLYDRVGI